MNIKDFLSPADTHVDMRASDKTRLLQELSRQAAAALGAAALVPCVRANRSMPPLCPSSQILSRRHAWVDHRAQQQFFRR